MILFLTILSVFLFLMLCVVGIWAYVVTKKALLLSDVLDDLVETYKPIYNDLVDIRNFIVKLSKTELFMDTQEVRELVRGIHKAKTIMERLVIVIEKAKEKENSGGDKKQKEVNQESNQEEL